MEVSKADSRRSALSCKGPTPTASNQKRRRKRDTDALGEAETVSGAPGQLLTQVAGAAGVGKAGRGRRRPRAAP